MVNLLVSIWVVLNCFDGVQLKVLDAYVPAAHATVSLTIAAWNDDHGQEDWLANAAGSSIAVDAYKPFFSVTASSPVSFAARSGHSAYLVNSVFRL